MNWRFSLPKQTLGRLLAVPLAAGVFWAFFSLGTSCQREDRITRLLRQFEREPSQKLADRLVELLDREAVSQAQGEAILRRLLTPKVVVRDTYPLGQPAYLTATTPVDLTFQKLRLHSKEWIEGLGQTGGSHDTQGGVWTAGARTYSGYPPARYPRTAKEASARQTCSAYLRYKFGLVRPRVVNGASWTENDPPTYVCDLITEVELRWVAPAEAEQVTRRSDPELDKTMSAAFTLEKSNTTTGYEQPGSTLHFSVVLWKLAFPALSENIGFRAAFRPTNGSEIRFPSFDCRRRAGAPGCVWIRLDDLGFPPGTYQGTIVLRPDEKVAYPDCAIKTIWGGTVGFPISFTVEKSK